MYDIARHLVDAVERDKRLSISHKLRLLFQLSQFKNGFHAIPPARRGLDLNMAMAYIRSVLLG